ncbi:MAG: PatB family C-S lyase [Betaproteobacteria bacterium]|nr:PatB family C-S lyase [Betaproteobacteria bacterium]
MGALALNFDFDQPLDRTDTHSLKWDGRLSRFGSRNVLPLWVADMDFPGPPQVSEALIARAKHPVYGYTLAHQGVYDSLINWTQDQFDLRLQREQIILAPGVLTSFHLTLQTFTIPGDGIILQTPLYAPFLSAIHASGRVPIENPLILEEIDGHLHYHMDLPHLEQCAALGAKILVLCSPHNPVGRVWQRDELQAVLNIARRHHLIVFSDEIHADLIYPEFQHTPLAQLASEDDRLIMAVSPGKTFNQPGLGLSALVIMNGETRMHMLSIMADMTTHNPFSLTAWEAAYHHGKAWRDALMLYLRDSREQIMHAIRQHWPQVRPISPQGTVLMWLDCRAYGLDDTALQALFVETYHLGLSPGIQFGHAGSGFMRLNLATPRQRLLAAITTGKPLQFQ